MSVLLLRLAGPLQSWGVASRFSRRETNAEPTKSGVLGILAAALGRRRTDPIEDLLALRFGVRVDQPGRLVRDFQTARTLDGKSMPLTYRFYLSDALFLAGVEGPDELLDGLHGALREPAFPLYLGRRSCPPAGPINLGIRTGSLDGVLRQFPWQAAEWHQRQQRAEHVSLRLVRDADVEEQGNTQRDVPLSFDPVKREYGWRTVVDAEPVLVENRHWNGGRDHDPIAALGG